MASDNEIKLRKLRRAIVQKWLLDSAEGETEETDALIISSEELSFRIWTGDFPELTEEVLKMLDEAPQ